tara:strand:+ start:3331 stop:4197 length:867 start_codon:yes stop_codon:yes gene_type:complete
MVEKLGIGTAQFGQRYGISNKFGKVSQSEAENILYLAKLNSIDIIDTAISYNSESCLGNIGVKEYKVVTKLPPVPNDIKNICEWIDVQIKSSLKRLRVNSVYGLLLHNSEDYKNSELREKFKSLKADKIIHKIGVSIYSPNELNNLPCENEIDIVQAPINLVDQRLVDSGWLKKLNSYGVEVHARSVFMQGLLLMPKKLIPQSFMAWSSLWNKWHDWLNRENITAIEACLHYVFSLPYVNRVIIGFEAANQLKQIVESLKSSLNISYLDISNIDENLVNPSIWPTHEK